MIKKIFLFLFPILFPFIFSVQAADPAPLRLIQSIPLPNVEGRIDHLAIDLKGQRVFVAALGNNTVEVIDLKMGKQVHSIAGLDEPQGVFFVPEFNQIVVTNGGNGKVEMFDGSSFKPLPNVSLGNDADNIRYDPSTHLIYAGYGNGALGVIDLSNFKKIESLPLEGHPEAFELEKSGAKIFVNVPDKNQIAVLDRNKQEVLAHWKTSTAQANFPMSLDETHHRLFVGFRQPAKLLVLDSESGKEIADLDIPRDTDDIFYDAVHKRIYISCGEGFIQVFNQVDADHYQSLAKIPTSSGARTSLFVPELNRLFLAVPHHGKQEARIEIYEVKT